MTGTGAGRMQVYSLATEGRQARPQRTTSGGPVRRVVGHKVATASSEPPLPYHGHSQPYWKH